MRKSLSILVVDDEPTLVEILSEELRILGHKVREAKNGSEALNILKSEHIDLVLSDMRMPHMSGMQLLEKLNATFPELRPGFVLITGFSDISADDVRAKGALTMLTKPYDFSDIITLVNSVDPIGM